MHKFQYVAVPASSSSGSSIQSNNNNKSLHQPAPPPKGSLNPWALVPSAPYKFIFLFPCSAPSDRRSSCSALFMVNPVGQIDWVCLGFISMSLILFTVQMYPEEKGTQGDKLITGHFRFVSPSPHTRIESRIDYYSILTWNIIREFNHLWPPIRNRRWAWNEQIRRVFANHSATHARQSPATWSS